MCRRLGARADAAVRKKDAQQRKHIQKSTMLAAMMGTPVQTFPLFLKVNVLSSETSERDLSVERFGRIRTSCQICFRDEWKIAAEKSFSWYEIYVHNEWHRHN